MALNDVAAEAPIGTHGQLQIQPTHFLDPGEGGAFPGFSRQVRGERLRGYLDRSKANAADGDAVAGLEFPGSSREAATVRRRCRSPLSDACDPPNLFDDAGKT
jgi:hypothetical protein